MDALAQLRKLKIEETALIKMLDVLKKQQNRLKIEELTLASKIREKGYANIASTSNLSTTIPSNSVTDKSQATSDKPEDVNKLHLNLSTVNSVPVQQLLSQPQLGEIESDEEDEYEYEEEEEEEEDRNVADVLASFLDC